MGPDPEPKFEGGSGPQTKKVYNKTEQYLTNLKSDPAKKIGSDWIPISNVAKKPLVNDTTV